MKKMMLQGRYCICDVIFKQYENCVRFDRVD